MSQRLTLGETKSLGETECSGGRCGGLEDGGEAEERESPPQSEPENPYERWPIRLNDGWPERRIRGTFSEEDQACEALGRAIDLFFADLEEIR